MSLREAQERLIALGYDLGPSGADGVLGPRTEGACVAYAMAQLGGPGAAQRISPRGIAAIAAHEGFVPGPYIDSVGVWTVYVGHTASAGDPDPAKMPRATPDGDLDAALAAGMAVFRRDLAKFEARVREHVKVPLAQHEFDALVSFDFNCAGVWYREKATGEMRHSTAITLLNAGHREAAAKAIMNWRTPASIIERREAEQRLFRTGAYPDAPMTVWDVTAAGKVLWTPLRRVPAADVAEMVVA